MNIRQLDVANFRSIFIFGTIANNKQKKLFFLYIEKSKFCSTVHLALEKHIIFLMVKTFDFRYTSLIRKFISAKIYFHPIAQWNEGA